MCCLNLQMCLLPWTVLVFLLSAGACNADVNLNWLTQIVDQVTLHCNIRGQFSLAMTIPKNLSPANLITILDNTQNIHNALRNNNLYISQRMIVATVGGNHAEVQVLNNLSELPFNSNDFLLFYTYLSPCARQCANPNDNRNILGIINNMRAWTDYALVFQKPYSDPRGQNPVTQVELTNALREIGSQIGNGNIFRCYRPAGSRYSCFRCFQDQNGQNVAPQCIEITTRQPTGNRNMG
ncbi:uncharacterized protein LOC117153028 [Anabas testudineus]|uniref:uncharacterized protein LOC117153028 n=1 Tax=Anabas testudineus TaxID=64144 RepID=UPI00143D2B1C|nr:uncharacterized protein LOC117153028 [Anabas testudineus]